MKLNTGKSVIVVDDVPENLHLLIEMLSEEGYHVRTAPSGELALQSIEKSPPDLILLDILMPGMDGFEVCRHLKSNEILKDIPVIFISALSEVFDKVEAFAIGGVDYITKPFQMEEVLARVQTHLSLRAMRQQLEEQNRELEAFSHTVAHDLKSPLATLAGSLHMIAMDLSEDDDALELLNLSLGSAQKMQNIIDELLLLSSVRSESVERHAVMMYDIVNQALGRLGHMMDYYQPEIHIQENMPIALGYGPWVEEVWVNYISNAIKYGGTPPIVEIGGETMDNNYVRFYVKDNGTGLDDSAVTKVFDEFMRMDKARAQGHGLGLSIVKRIVDKLGGQVGVKSRIGEGSMFYFILPADL